MIKRKQNGFVIELMIVFMLVTFGFCMLMTTFLGTLNLERKYAKESVSVQTDLNQVGEYYLRYIEESGEQFPKGNETSFNTTKYNWMDDDAKEFFINFNKKYKYTFTPAFSITRGSFLEFFKTKYIWRKLVVRTSDNNIKMIIELKEQRVSDTDTEYYIQNWSVGSNLVDESAESGGYQEDKLTLLQKLWKFLGLEINSLKTWNPTGDLKDLLTLFNDVSNNWREATKDGV